MPASASGHKILVIDDEESIVAVICEILRRRNYQPVGAVRWTEALDVINNDPPDLILLDLKMPTIHGSSMLEFIRSEGIEIPVIVVSGFITPEVTRDLSGMGVRGFVNKPFQAARLTSEVERVLEGVPSSSATPEGALPPAVLAGTASAEGVSRQPAGTAAADRGRAEAAGPETAAKAVSAKPPEPATAAVPEPDQEAFEGEVTMDALYRLTSKPDPARPSQPAGRVSGAGQVRSGRGGPVPKMDVLYQMSEDEISALGPPPNNPPSDEEVFQILYRINGNSPSPEAQAAPASPAAANGNGEDDATREVLRALQKFDRGKQAPGAEAGAAPQTSAPQAHPPSHSPSPHGARPSPDAGHRPSRLPPPSPLASPVPQDLFPEREGEPVHRSHHRPRRSRNKLPYVVISLVCVVIAGILAIFQWMANQIDIQKMKEQATEAMTKAAMDQVKKQVEDQREQMKRQVLEEELQKRGR